MLTSLKASPGWPLEASFFLSGAILAKHNVIIKKNLVCRGFMPFKSSVRVRLECVNFTARFSLRIIMNRTIQGLNSVFEFKACNGGE